MLISGIAVPTPFIREAEKYSNKVLPVVFPDHHTFSKSDFKKLDVIFEKMTSPGKLILVTEKDAARLKNSPLVPESWKKYLYYLPIVIRFYNEQSFNETIKKHIITFPKIIYYKTNMSNRTEISTLGEFGLIRHLTDRIEIKNNSTIKGVGDDAAILSYEDRQVLVTTDLLLEGIHFDLTYVPLKHLGYKSAVVNFSDIYAMNGQPKQITVSLGISKRFLLRM